MNIFNINEVRKIIFSYLYPCKLLKGMEIKIVKSKFHPFLQNKIVVIDNIEYIKNKSYIKIIKESNNINEIWYKAITYISFENGDIFKVTKSV